MDEEPDKSCDIGSQRRGIFVANQPENANLKGQTNTSTTDAERSKAITIRQACSSHNIKTLIVLATTEHGLVDDEVRREACMF